MGAGTLCGRCTCTCGSPLRIKSTKASTALVSPVRGKGCKVVVVVVMHCNVMVPLTDDLPGQRFARHVLYCSCCRATDGCGWHVQQLNQGQDAILRARRCECKGLAWSVTTRTASRINDMHFGSELKLCSAPTARDTTCGVQL